MNDELELEKWWVGANGTGTAACPPCTHSPEKICSWHRARLDDLQELITRHEQAAYERGRQDLAEAIVSNSTMDTGSLRGGKDTFTIDKVVLWKLAQQPHNPGESE